MLDRWNFEAERLPRRQLEYVVRTAAAKTPPAMSALHAIGDCRQLTDRLCDS